MNVKLNLEKIQQAQESHEEVLKLFHKHNTKQSKSIKTDHINDKNITYTISGI